MMFQDTPMLENPKKKPYDSSRYAGLKVDPAASAEQYGTGILATSQPSQGKQMAGGILQGIGQAFSKPEEEEPMPQLQMMPNQGVIGKQPFQAPNLPQLQSGIGQAALL